MTPFADSFNALKSRLDWRLKDFKIIERFFDGHKFYNYVIQSIHILLDRSKYRGPRNVSARSIG